MGIQLYIKKEALTSRNIDITYNTYREQCDCMCGARYAGFCVDCDTEAVDIETITATVIGLPVMEVFNETIWSDANTWGSNRAPIMEFIELHNINKDEWYEA